MALEAFATGKRRDDLCLPQVRARHVRGHAETDSVVKEAFVPRGALIVFGRAGRRADAVVRQPGGIAPGLGEVLRAQGIECAAAPRSEEHTSELQSLMRISYAVFCLKKQNNNYQNII